MVETENNDGQQVQGDEASKTKRKHSEVDTSNTTTAATPNMPRVTSKDANHNANQFVGLSNQGATCYLNSLLQSLYNTPEIREMLYKWKYNPDLDARLVFNNYLLTRQC